MMQSAGLRQARGNGAALWTPEVQATVMGVGRALVTAVIQLSLASH